MHCSPILQASCVAVLKQEKRLCKSITSFKIYCSPCISSCSCRSITNWEDGIGLSHAGTAFWRLIDLGSTVSTKVKVTLQTSKRECTSDSSYWTRQKMSARPIGARKRIDVDCLAVRQVDRPPLDLCLSITLPSLSDPCFAPLMACASTCPFQLRIDLSQLLLLSSIPQLFSLPYSFTEAASCTCYR